MLVSKFSRDGKRGFSIGSNSLTPEKVVAGAFTASSALLIAAIGGILGRHPKKRIKKDKKSVKKKKSLWLLLLPLIYKEVSKNLKAKDTQALLAGLAAQYSKSGNDEPADMADEEADDGKGIEIIEAIPISSENEVYDYI